MSGNVNINHCNFINNTKYSSHGAAIQYLSNYANSQIAINNCNFTKNSGALSIIFIGQLEIPLYTMHRIYILNNSYLYDNQGTSIRLFNQNLYITGKSVFSNNTAENGPGIFTTDHSNIVFSKHSTTIFDSNTALNSGGAIYLANYSQMIFEEKSIVLLIRIMSQMELGDPLALIIQKSYSRKVLLYILITTWLNMVELCILMIILILYLIKTVQ